MTIHAPNYVPEQAESPPDAPYREVQDEASIRDALAEVAELESSLRHLDRHSPNDSHFKGWRGGEDKLFDAYRALKIIRKDLKEMLED